MSELIDAYAYRFKAVCGKCGKDLYKRDIACQAKDGECLKISVLPSNPPTAPVEPKDEK